MWANDMNSCFFSGELEDSKLKHAECMVKLGEIGLETGNLLLVYGFILNLCD